MDDVRKKWRNHLKVERCNVCGRFTPKTFVSCGLDGVLRFLCERCKSTLFEDNKDSVETITFRKC